MSTSPLATAAIRGATDSIVIECDLPHAPAKVWRALTEPALLGSWLMPNDIRAEIGHRFTFRATPVHGMDADVQCEVLAVEKGRLLSYSWRVGPTLDTVVTWTVRASETGTRLRLDHDGFASDAPPIAPIRANWQRLMTGCLNGQLAKLPS